MPCTLALGGTITSTRTLHDEGASTCDVPAGGGALPARTLPPSALDHIVFELPATPNVLSSMAGGCCGVLGYPTPAAAIAGPREKLLYVVTVVADESR